MTYVIERYGFSMISGKHLTVPEYFVEFKNYTAIFSSDISRAQVYECKEELRSDAETCTRLSSKTSTYKIGQSVDFIHELEKL